MLRRSELSGGCENSNEPSSWWLADCMAENEVPTRKMAGMRASRSMKVISEPMLEIAMPIFMPSVPTS